MRDTLSRARIPATVMAIGTAIATSVWAEEVTILIDRGADSTELYVSARADVLFALFDSSPSVLTGHAEFVDFGPLRQGTFGAGDALLAETEITIGDQDARFEAMSLMVHPIEDKLPMRTPVEALIAIGVCNGPPAGVLVPVPQLEGYVGYFSDRGSVDRPVSLEFPVQDELVTSVVVHDFGGVMGDSTYKVTLPQDNRLELAPPAKGVENSLLLPALGFVFGILALGSALARSESDPAEAFGM